MSAKYVTIAKLLVVILSGIMLLANQGMRKVDNVPTQPKVRIAKINANGRVHDDDGIGSPDEEESYSFSKNIHLEVGGFSKEWTEHKVVDGEIDLRMKLKLQADSSGVITASGNLELWEGPGWNMGASNPIDATNISPDETKTLFDAKIEDDEGDWATVKIEIQNSDG